MATLPVIGSAVIDPATGTMNRDWYLALLSVSSQITGTVVSNVTLLANNGITVTGSPITSAGVITLGIGNLTCATAEVAGTVTAARAVITGTVTAADIVASATVLAVNIRATATVTSANIIATGTLTSVNVVTTQTVAAVGMVATGRIEPSQTIGILGTNTNNNANAGSFGEYMEGILASASAINLSSGTTANLASVSLTAGDWDVSGSVAFVPAIGTSITLQAGGISSVSATFPVVAAGGIAQAVSAAQIPAGLTEVLPISPVRFSITSTTVVYVIVSASFTASTMTAYGGIRARRIR